MQIPHSQVMPPHGFGVSLIFLRVERQLRFPAHRILPAPKYPMHGVILRLWRIFYVSLCRLHLRCIEIKQVKVAVSWSQQRDGGPVALNSPLADHGFLPELCGALRLARGTEAKPPA